MAQLRNVVANLGEVVAQLRNVVANLGKVEAQLRNVFANLGEVVAQLRNVVANLGYVVMVQLGDVDVQCSSPTTFSSAEPVCCHCEG